MLNDLVYEFIILIQSVEWVKKRIASTIRRLDAARKRGDLEAEKKLSAELEHYHHKISCENKTMDALIEKYKEIQLCGETCEKI